MARGKSININKARGPFNPITDNGETDPAKRNKFIRDANPGITSEQRHAIEEQIERKKNEWWEL